MKKKVQVILLEDVISLGSAGDIIFVSEGYARNLLFPQGKAALASEQAITSAEEKKEKTKIAATRKLADLQARAQALEGTELIITAKAKEGEGDELYGSITAAQIAKQFNASSGLDIKTKNIALEKPITALGHYDITIKLSADVETTIRVTVTPEEEVSAHAGKQKEA
ncbi:MAG: 50S ribosomal protein L9 [bacterium]